MAPSGQSLDRSGAAALSLPRVVLVTADAVASLCAVDQRLDVCDVSERDPDRAVRTAAYTALRLILNACGATDLARRPFVRSPGGKPVCDGDEAPAFSISHTDAAALVAVATTGPLGVDLEQPRDRLRMSLDRRVSIGAACAGHGLATEAEAAAAHNDDAAFLQVWTRLEAWAKARGDGIGAVLEEIGARGKGAQEERATRLSADGAAGLEPTFSTHTLSLPAPYLGALSWPSRSSPPTPEPVDGLVAELCAAWQG